MINFRQYGIKSSQETWVMKNKNLSMIKKPKSSLSFTQIMDWRKHPLYLAAMEKKNN